MSEDATCGQEAQKGNIFGNYRYPPSIPDTNAKRNHVSDIQCRAGRYRRHRADWRAVSDAGNQTRRVVCSYHRVCTTPQSRCSFLELWLQKLEWKHLAKPPCHGSRWVPSTWSRAHARSDQRLSQPCQRPYLVIRHVVQSSQHAWHLCVSGAADISALSSCD